MSGCVTACPRPPPLPEPAKHCRMALIRCAECGIRISEKATSCNSCGHPTLMSTSSAWDTRRHYIPRFSGTPEEAKANFASHDFRKVYLKDRFPEVINQELSVTECSKCEAIKGSGLDWWPCGAPPEFITFNSWKAEQGAGQGKRRRRGPEPPPWVAKLRGDPA